MRQTPKQLRVPRVAVRCCCKGSSSSSLDGRSEFDVTFGEIQCRYRGGKGKLRRDEMRLRPFVQRLVMHQDGGAEGAGLAAAEGPFAAVAIGGTDIAVEVEAAVMDR